MERDRRSVGRSQCGRLGKTRSGPCSGDGHSVAHHDDRARTGSSHLDLTAASTVLDPRADVGRYRHDHDVGRRGLAAVEQLVGSAGVGPQIGGRPVPRPRHVGLGRERHVHGRPGAGYSTRGRSRSEGEQGGRRRGVARVEGPHRIGGREGGVRGVPASGVDRDRSHAAAEDVLVLDRSVGDEVQDLVDPPGVHEQRVGKLREDADVGLPGRSKVSDQCRTLALEDGDQAGIGAFDRFLEDDVGLVEPSGRSVIGVVADLGCQRGPGRHDVARCRVPRQGAGDDHRRRCSRRGRRRGDGSLGHGRPAHRGDDQHPADEEDSDAAHHVPLDLRRPRALLAQLLAGQDGRGPRVGPDAGFGAIASPGERLGRGRIVVRHHRDSSAREGGRWCSPGSNIEQTFGSTVAVSHRNNRRTARTIVALAREDDPETGATGTLRRMGVTPLPYGRPGPVNDSTEEKQTRHGT